MSYSNKSIENIFYSKWWEMEEAVVSGSHFPDSIVNSVQLSYSSITLATTTKGKGLQFEVDRKVMRKVETDKARPRLIQNCIVNCYKRYGFMCRISTLRDSQIEEQKFPGFRVHSYVPLWYTYPFVSHLGFTMYDATLVCRSTTFYVPDEVIC